MKQIIEAIIQRHGNHNSAEQEVVCNYDDNYYGDQICVPRKAG